MKKKFLLSFLTLVILAACSKTAFTGRKQLNLIPDSELNQMSFAEYKSFLSGITYRLSIFDNLIGIKFSFRK